jgi:ribonuclease HI
MSFYAVAKGRQIGIFTSWSDCNESVKSYPYAKYKKFDTKEEAERFVEDYSYIKKENEKEKEKELMEPEYYVYTDGACSNNGKKNACAGIGIYFGKNDTRNVSERIEGKQTNNKAELTAIIKVYHIIETDLLENKIVTIVSDSEYAIRCATTYGEKCDQSGWKKEIPNKELVKQAYELYKDCKCVQFKHIMAHTQKTDIHSLGNEQADKLANRAIDFESCPYQKI